MLENFGTGSLDASSFKNIAWFFQTKVSFYMICAPYALPHIQGPR